MIRFRHFDKPLFLLVVLVLCYQVTCWPTPVHNDDNTQITKETIRSSALTLRIDEDSNSLAFDLRLRQVLNFITTKVDYYLEAAAELGTSGTALVLVGSSDESDLGRDAIVLNSVMKDVYVVLLKGRNDEALYHAFYAYTKKSPPRTGNVLEIEWDIIDHFEVKWSPAQVLGWTSCGGSIFVPCKLANRNRKPLTSSTSFREYKRLLPLLQEGENSNRSVFADLVDTEREQVQVGKIIDLINVRRMNGMQLEKTTHRRPLVPRRFRRSTSSKEIEQGVQEAATSVESSELIQDASGSARIERETLGSRESSEKILEASMPMAAQTDDNTETTTQAVDLTIVQVMTTEESDGINEETLGETTDGNEDEESTTSDDVPWETLGKETSNDETTTNATPDEPEVSTDDADEGNTEWTTPDEEGPVETLGEDVTEDDTTTSEVPPEEPEEEETTEVAITPGHEVEWETLGEDATTPSNEQSTKGDVSSEEKESSTSSSEEESCEVKKYRKKAKAKKKNMKKQYRKKSKSKSKMRKSNKSKKNQHGMKVKIKIGIPDQDKSKTSKKIKKTKKTSSVGTGGGGGVSFSAGANANFNMGYQDGNGGYQYSYGHYGGVVGNIGGGVGHAAKCGWIAGIDALIKFPVKAAGQIMQGTADVLISLLRLDLFSTLNRFSQGVAGVLDTVGTGLVDTVDTFLRGHIGGINIIAGGIFNTWTAYPLAYGSAGMFGGLTPSPDICQQAAWVARTRGRRIQKESVESVKAEDGTDTSIETETLDGQDEEEEESQSQESMDALKDDTDKLNSQTGLTENPDAEQLDTKRRRKRSISKDQGRKTSVNALTPGQVSIVMSKQLPTVKDWTQNEIEIFTSMLEGTDTTLFAGNLGWNTQDLTSSQLHRLNLGPKFGLDVFTGFGACDKRRHSDQEVPIDETRLEFIIRGFLEFLRMDCDLPLLNSLTQLIVANELELDEEHITFKVPATSALLLVNRPKLSVTEREHLYLAMEFAAFTQTLRGEVSIPFTSRSGLHSGNHSASHIDIDSQLLSANTKIFLKFSLNLLRSILTQGRFHSYALGRQLMKTIKTASVKILQDISRLNHVADFQTDIGSVNFNQQPHSLQQFLLSINSIRLRANMLTLKNDFIYLLGLEVFVPFVLLGLDDGVVAVDGYVHLENHYLQTMQHEYPRLDIRYKSIFS